MVLTILILLVLGLLAYSLYPLMKPRRSLIEAGGDFQRRMAALEREKRMAALELEKTGCLRAIKDVEFERATGKLSDADYEDLHAFYTRKTFDALTAIAALQEEAEHDDSGS